MHAVELQFARQRQRVRAILCAAGVQHHARTGGRGIRTHGGGKGAQFLGVHLRLAHMHAAQPARQGGLQAL